MRCAKLPVGTFEVGHVYNVRFQIGSNFEIYNFQLRVIAENLGGNNGEIGFLPIRLARDSAGQQMIC